MDIHADLLTRLDVRALCNTLRECGWLRIENFLPANIAEGLYTHLRNDVRWRTYLIANQRLLSATSDPCGLADESEIRDFVYEGARNGFASLHDADRPFPEDIPGSMSPAQGNEQSRLTAFYDLMRSTSFIELTRQVVGVQDISAVAVQATRFRPGHFVGFHGATWSADKTGLRRASFFVNLTPAWRPEWGGMLEFRRDERGTLEGLSPSFNSLDVIAFPHGYWISAVAPFAGEPRFALSGRLYSSAS